MQTYPVSDARAHKYHRSIPPPSLLARPYRADDRLITSLHPDQQIILLARGGKATQVVGISYAAGQHAQGGVLDILHARHGRLELGAERRARYINGYIALA